jgi:glycosyltransferase involved in cell wall biosynthesis
VRTSFLQRVPFSNRAFRLLAPFYPAAFEQLDLSEYDLIVSSTTAWSKGVRFRPDAFHVCYIHTVSRFVFDYERYVGGFTARGAATLLTRPLVTRLARWDIEAARRPSAYIASSHNAAERIRRYYGREALVVPCPVDVDRFSIGLGDGDFFLAVSRLLPYKRLELAIGAAAMANVALKIVGQGPAEAALRRIAKGTRTEFLGVVSDAELGRLMGRARAVVVPGEEDFGLVALEANASGRPAIAYARGGALETVRGGVTGEFFEDAQPAALARLLEDFDPSRYDPRVLRAHAETFRPERFIERLRTTIDALIAERNSAASSQPLQQR